MYSKFPAADGVALNLATHAVSGRVFWKRYSQCRVLSPCLEGR